MSTGVKQHSTITHLHDKAYLPLEALVQLLPIECDCASAFHGTAPHESYSSMVGLCRISDKV